MLRTFCLYAATGILFLYLLVITFFVGYEIILCICVIIFLTILSMIYRTLCLDEDRIDKRKAWSWSKPKGDTWEPNKLSQKELGKTVFAKFIAPALCKWHIKVSLIVIFVNKYLQGVLCVFPDPGDNCCDCA